MTDLKTKVIAVIVLFLGIFSAFLGLTSNSADAASTSGFKAGNIMTDYVMKDYTSLDAAGIQSFLKAKGACKDTDLSKTSVGATKAEEVKVSKNGVTYNRRIYFGQYSALYHVEGGHFVCLADEKFDGKSAAEIIYAAAQEYKINPKVLIVLLQKEQGLITDSFPNEVQYRAATGYGCPDTAACDSEYYGFKNQVESAAYLFHAVVYDGKTNYPVGNNYIQYSPDKSCGGSTVKIENLATSALYRYTPYQPNAAALAAGYGSGVSCGAYGNRNFYLYYTDWFGSTQMVSTASRIEAAYNSNDGANKLGKAKGEASCVDKAKASETSARCFQEYEKGHIYSSEFGTFLTYGGIDAKYTGTLKGWMGWPKTKMEMNSKTGIIYQEYEKGFIVGNDTYGYHDSSGMIRTVWAKSGFESGKFGFPVEDVQMNAKTGIFYQKFQNGYIVGSDKTGYFESRGKTREVWEKYSFEFGILGFPLSDVQMNKETGMIYQQYQKGYVVGNDKVGYHISQGMIRGKWESERFEYGKFGFPLEDIVQKDGVFSQKFQGGTIYWSSGKGVWTS